MVLFIRNILKIIENSIKNGFVGVEKSLQICIIKQNNQCEE
jgi:hypothetical protein